MTRRTFAATIGSLAAAGAPPAGEFIFESAPFPSCHASTIVHLKNEDLLSAWFGGTAEGRPDVAVWGARKAGGKWSAPLEMAREKDVACYNPVLFHTRDGRLWLYYKFGRSPDTWSAARTFSTDEGQTWAPKEYLPAGLYGPIRAAPLVMDGGTVVSGTSVESYGSWAVWIERSVDHGRKFTRIGPVVVGGDAGAKESGPRSRGIIQPSVVWMGGRKLRLYARATPQIGRICIADSGDAGLTWTDARPIEVPNPNSGIDAVRLPDGRVLLVYNNTPKGRTPLTLAVSKDGEQFRAFRDLETEPGEYSYPSMIVGRDSAVHITYTWKRQRIRYVRLAVKDISA